MWFLIWIKMVLCAFPVRILCTFIWIFDVVFCGFRRKITGNFTWRDTHFVITICPFFETAFNHKILYQGMPLKPHKTTFAFDSNIRILHYSHIMRGFLRPICCYRFGGMIKRCQHIGPDIPDIGCRISNRVCDILQMPHFQF